MQIAIKIVKVLGQIYQKYIIHKGINPSNIVINPERLAVKLIDFGISTVLSQETPAQKNLIFLEGTLIYMSPKQTDRMNRALDYCTELIKSAL